MSAMARLWNLERMEKELLLDRDRLLAKKRFTKLDRFELNLVNNFLGKANHSEVSRT